MAHQGRSASLGRNPSGDFIKRRKSWQDYSDSHARQTPDVRSFVGRQATPKFSLKTRAECGAFPWHTCLQWVLAVAAVLVTAGAAVTVIAIASHSTFAYSRWVEVRDGTTYYVEQLDEFDALVLLATFVGAAIIVVLVYVLFSLMLSKFEARSVAPKGATGLDELTSRDLEQGDAPIKTRQSIARMMSDAEKQYVAEYLRKSAPPGIVRKQPVATAPANSQITVQKLDQNDSVGLSQGIFPPRSWSLKRMLSMGRAEAEKQKRAALPVQERAASPERGVPSSEMAAQLSSPDAFNRASSSYANMADTSRHTEASTQDSDPATPTTPTMGELFRQRRETCGAEGEESPASGSTRIMVTKPIEVHGEGSAGTESEEEEYDRERQHSILPHPASNPPFRSQILQRFPQQGLEEGERGSSLGWQEVGLDSDEEGRRSQERGQGQPLGHIFPETGLVPQKSAELKPSEQLELRPSDSMEAQDQRVQSHIDLEFEEVLPRPQAGLLNRLLRLARVERINLADQAPAFVIHPGKEYMIGVKMKNPPSSERMLHAKWIRIQPPDGQPVRFNIEEESSKPGEWTGSACWDTSLHSSEILASATHPDAEEGVPVQITLGLESSATPTYKVEANGTLRVILHAALQSRLRGSEERRSSVSKASATASYCLL